MFFLSVSVMIGFGWANNINNGHDNAHCFSIIMQYSLLTTVAAAAAVAAIAAVAATVVVVVILFYPDAWNFIGLKKKCRARKRKCERLSKTPSFCNGAIFPVSASFQPTFYNRTNNKIYSCMLCCSVSQRCMHHHSPPSSILNGKNQIWWQLSNERTSNNNQYEWKK